MPEKLTFDRTVFKIIPIEEKGQNWNFWLRQWPADRLQHSWYLTCAAYNLPYDASYRMDRSAFWMGKLQDRQKLKKQ
ncbi:MAG: hypothetical protein WAT22_16840 [Saprospiraceae bacterium]|jgi:hypothetical protein